MNRNQKVRRWMQEEGLKLQAAADRCREGDEKPLSKNTISRIMLGQQKWRRPADDDDDEVGDTERKLVAGMGTTREWFSDDSANWPMPIRVGDEVLYRLTRAQLRILDLAEEMSRQPGGEYDPTLKRALDRFLGLDEPADYGKAIEDDAGGEASPRTRPNNKKGG